MFKAITLILNCSNDKVPGYRLDSETKICNRPIKEV